MKSRGIAPKEAKKPPSTPMARFLAAIGSQNLHKAQTLLSELERHPPPGLWMHAALSKALGTPKEVQLDFVELLLNSKTPPTDTSNADFIATAIGFRCEPLVIKALLDAGFCPGRKGFHTLLELVRPTNVYHNRKDIPLEWIKAHHLGEAEDHCVIETCARVMCQNPSHPLISTLEVCLIKRMPKEEIVKRVTRDVSYKLFYTETTFLPQEMEATGLVDLEALRNHIKSRAKNQSLSTNDTPHLLAWLEQDTLARQTVEIASAKTPSRRL